MTIPGSSVTMEEIGEQLAVAAAGSTDASTVKLEGDSIPEALRGKTVADLIRERDVLAQSVDIANKARKAAEEAGGVRTVERVVEREPVAAPAKLTKEQLAMLFEQDPIAAVGYMQDIALKEAEGAFERRFAPLAAGSASNAEASAKARFANEFALFGADIKQITDSLPDKSILANSVGWDNIIAYVRGKPGNFEKLIEANAAKAAEAAALAAREGQDRSAGASLTSSVRAAAPVTVSIDGGSTFGLDTAERKAADDMDISYKEYAKWKNIG